MPKEFWEGVRGQMIALSNEGVSQRKIATKFNISKGAVQRTAERFPETESYSSRSRSGRPRATTSAEDQYIRITSLRDRMATAGEIQASLNQTREKPVSKSTVKRRLVGQGLHGRIAVSKPFLRPQNKHKN